MRGNSRRITGQFQPMQGWPCTQHRRVIKCLPILRPPRVRQHRRATLSAATWLVLAAASGLAGAVGAQTGLSTAAGTSQITQAVRDEVQRMAKDAALVLWGSARQAPRIEVEVGELAPHLKLAPCKQVQPYLPSGMRPLGRSRLGLRCVDGVARWNVFLPVTVRLWAPSLVASMALPAGTVLEARHLATAEVDLAERAAPAIGNTSLAIGRSLQRSLSAGAALRQSDLKTRQMFNTGDTVRIVGIGPGYAVSSEGQAMGPGLEGQNARVRTDSGRIVTGIATALRRVEIAL
jgi:flagellar basal body P-ring formation protein FlgA